MTNFRITITLTLIFLVDVLLLKLEKPINLNVKAFFNIAISIPSKVYDWRLNNAEEINRQGIIQALNLDHYNMSKDNIEDTIQRGSNNGRKNIFKFQAIKKGTATLSFSNIGPENKNNGNSVKDLLVK